MKNFLLVALVLCAAPAFAGGTEQPKDSGLSGLGKVWEDLKPVRSEFMRGLTGRRQVQPMVLKAKSWEASIELRSISKLGVSEPSKAQFAVGTVRASSLAIDPSEARVIHTAFPVANQTATVILPDSCREAAQFAFSAGSGFALKGRLSSGNSGTSADGGLIYVMFDQDAFSCAAVK
jgi:hypothetical protein